MPQLILLLFYCQFNIAMSEDAFPLQSLPISHAIELIATIEDHFQATNRLNFQLEQ